MIVDGMRRRATRLRQKRRRRDRRARIL